MSERRAIFISHATPEDNPFTIWLGAKLAAAGYEVWADVLRLIGGDDWQRKLENGLRNRACKVLLVANQKAVEKQGVRNEIQIASDVARKVGDDRFIIPLRLGSFEAPFLIAHAQYIDFSQGWAAGLHELLAALRDEYKVPFSASPTAEIWSSLQTIHGRNLEPSPEYLVSNWLRIRKIPGALFYYRNTELHHHGIKLSLPKVPYADGYLSCEEHRFQGLSRASLKYVLSQGWPELGIPASEIRKAFTRLAHQGMDLLLKSRGLEPFDMASHNRAWWFGGDLPDTRLAFHWGKLKGSRVLRGTSSKRKMQWHFGITSHLRGGPDRYFRIKSHVFLTEDGKTPLSPKRMHRMRRSFTKGWRNPRWRDMLLAFLFWLSNGESTVRLPLHFEDDLVIEVPPLQFISPVSISEGEEVESDDDETEEESTDEGEYREDEYDDDEEEA